MDFLIESGHDFMWAVAQMKEEKKVRRKEWGKNVRVNLPGSSVICYSGCNGDDAKKACIDDVEATDWEIYEECKFCIQNKTGILSVSKDEEFHLCGKHRAVFEKGKDNWNLADCGNTWIYSSAKEDVKTFIQKVKEDDDESNKFIQNSKHEKNHPLEYKRGYSRAMHDTKLHREKRTGDL